MATRLELGALEGPEVEIMELWNDQKMESIDIGSCDVPSSKKY